MARAASSPCDGMFPSSRGYQTWEGSIAASHVSSSLSNAAMDRWTTSMFSSDMLVQYLAGGPSCLDFRPNASLDDLKLLRRAAQVAVPIRLQDHQILDPHAEAARNVDPRLHGHGIAGAQLVLRGDREAGRLVDLQAHAVTEPMAEVVPVPSLG